MNVTVLIVTMLFLLLRTTLNIITILILTALTEGVLE
jgi:hypothetical protein